MSKTLSQIRETFHDAILVREANQFVLTHKAQQLKAQLPSLIQQLDELYVPATMEPQQCQRKFTFASSDYVAQAILPIIFSKLQQQAPLASVEYELWHKDRLTQLADSSLDLVSTITAQVPENLYGKMMAQDQLVVVFRSSHALAQSSMSVDDYTHARHILISGGGDKDSTVDRALSALGQERSIFATVPFFQSAIELLLATDTILTTPLHIAADFAQRYDLQIKPLPLEVAPQHYYLLWHAKHHQDPAHRWFRELCYPLLKQHLEATTELGMKLIHTNKS